MSLKEITERYRSLAADLHPDKGGDPIRMARVNEAYELLRRYIENYRFSFSEEEVRRQFPAKEHARRFRF